MNFAMIALILTIWALPVPGETAAWSTKLAKFLTALNGNYSEDGPHNYEGKKQAYVQLRTFPLEMAAFPGLPVMFVEWAYQRMVTHLQLATLSEDNKGVIQLTIYNIPKPKNYRFGNYKIEDLVKLTTQDLQRPTMIYHSETHFSTYPGSSWYQGMWPGTGSDYKLMPEDRQPTLSVHVESCNSLTAEIPDHINWYPMHNLILAKNSKYPVPNLPAGFRYSC